ncbi:MAG: hypothetical protein HYX32_15265 [Actinobacteria bacterium]|nr:hypothetical protein [Actinomycetota bacterium]
MTSDEVPLDLSALERLAVHLELWSAALSESERRLLVTLVGLGARELGTTRDLEDLHVEAAVPGEVTGFVVMSPSFADALSPAADIAAQAAIRGRYVALAFEVSRATEPQELGIPRVRTIATIHTVASRPRTASAPSPRPSPQEPGMPELTIDRDTLDSLTAKLGMFSDRLTDDERAHLLALLALAAAEIVKANDIIVDNVDDDVSGFVYGMQPWGEIRPPKCKVDKEGKCLDITQFIDWLNDKKMGG